jgi:hypothetical protein
MYTSTKTFGLLLVLLVVCLFGHIAQAKYGASGLAGSAETSTYVFVPDQSKLVQTGGIAGVHWTYSIKGEFQLTIDPNAGAASFAHVDANATDDSPFKRTLDLNYVFNMTSLVGTVEPSGSIKFTGKAPDDSDVRITVTLEDNLAHLIGQTTPPPNSADFFIFSLDAVAQLRKYGGGSGTAEDPYQIATAADLIALGDSPDDYDKHFVLTADIDLDPNLPGRKVFTKAVIVPTWHTLFTGVFDGNGHAISHLTINGVGYIGLFGQLGSGAEVKDVHVADANITGSGGYYVGALAGYNLAAVTGCYSSGAVTGDSDVGGLVGENSGDVTDCHSAASVSGDDYVGGLVGTSYWGSVTGCYSSGVVSGGNYVGGLVGHNGGSVIHCCSTGMVRGSTWVGALVGLNGLEGIVGGWESCPITDCFSTSPVTATSEVGGLVGWNMGDVTCCYSMGTLDGNEDVGGLVGLNGGTITDSYSLGNVVASSAVGGLVGSNGQRERGLEFRFAGAILNCYCAASVSGVWYVGGLVGDNTDAYGNKGCVTDCFWDIQTSGQATSDGGTGKTTAEMQTASTFLEAGWDFVNVWGIGENQTYPYLRKYSAPDINQDGNVNFLDLAVLAENWLTGMAP